MQQPFDPIPISAFLLCLAAALFPFSVAGTNVALAAALIASVFTGQWRAGAMGLWHKHRGLVLAMLVYFGLMLLGLLWSSDRLWGLKNNLGHQWFWLLVPAIFVALGEKPWQERFLLSLSIGLALHLAYCTAQLFGYAPADITADGKIDPAGFIGHIGFGFVYGIWGAWLLHWGWAQSGWRRYGAWLLALWSWGMIFSTPGRSGYLVAVAAAGAVLWKLSAGRQKWAATAALLLLTVGALTIGPAKDRFWQTVLGLQAARTGDIARTEARWSMWIAAVEAWKGSPWLGVGTGGFPEAAKRVRAAHPELDYSEGQGLQTPPAHPHNMYLLALAQWSVWGLAALLAWLFLWVREGWRLDWKVARAGPILTLSGLALAIHGLSAPSLEEHFSGILAALLLGLGLAQAGQEP